MSPTPRRLAIGFGSSLGPRRLHIERAVNALDRAKGLTLRRCSRLVRTPPMRGGTASGWFLNAVGLYTCELAPEQVLELCRQLEEAAGRRRERYWGDRTLDLDVLLDEMQTVQTPTLTVPHPAIAKRPFVIGPLLEVWPQASHPQTGQKYADTQLLSGPMAVTCGVLARPG